MPWKQQLPSPHSPSPVHPSARGHAGGSGGVLQPQLSESQMYSRPSPHSGGSSTGSGPHPFDPRESAATGADSSVLLAGDDGGCWPGPDEQPAAKRTAAMGTIREKSSGVVEERTGHPSLLQEAEAASPKTPDAYYLRLVAAAARGNTNNFLSSRLGTLIHNCL